jgi:AraC-like DNA-binding protein
MHIAYLTTMMEELASRGIDASDLVHPMPKDIGPDQLAGLLSKAMRLSGDPAFGLSFGLRLNLASHGMLGYALMSSRNGKQLINSLTRFSRLAMPSIELSPIETSDQLQLICRARANVENPTVYIEIVLATLIGGARALFHQRVPGAAIWLDYPPPAHAEKYNQLRVPIHFNRSDCALVCDRSFLAAELPSANPVLAEIGQRQCYELLQGMKKKAGVAKTVRAELIKGSGQFPSQDILASRLNISGRSLRRQLREEHTTYRELTDEVRFELAQRYLETKELPITEIAALLGYEDPANFRRAFKRWSGMTAQAWQMGL